MLSLITARWLPAIDRAGQRKKIALEQLLDDNIVDLAYPRADFQGAGYQFLIGLLQTLLAPKDEAAWLATWQRGIVPNQLKQALQTLQAVLHFGPDKPAFLQDFSTLDTENTPISGLLIDAPGCNTLKLNKDLFIKRHSVQAICAPCAAIALYAVQANSPAGGAGHRTGMRGGGPITTLVLPRQGMMVPLWQKIWLNVLPQATAPSTQDLPLIFPWLAPTRTSERAVDTVTPQNAHPLQAYWSMPRRIEIDFTHTHRGICDLCGEEDGHLLTQMRSKNYGVNYQGWEHPLTPYRQALKSMQALPLKGQPGGLTYKEWPGLVSESENRFNHAYPAAVVRQHVRRHLGFDSELWCFGFDMDNAKARCWYELHLPLQALPPQGRSQLSDALIPAITLAAGSLSLLKLALKEAWFSMPQEVKADLHQLDTAYWQETEALFRQLLIALAADLHFIRPATELALSDWQQALYHYLFQQFDRLVFTDPDDTRGLQRHTQARANFRKNYLQQRALADLARLPQVQQEVAYG